MTLSEPFKISLPGAFDRFFEGTSVGQNATLDSPGAVDLAARYRTATVVRRGKGYTLHLDGLSLDAVATLKMYAETCIDLVRYGDLDASQMRAAQRVLADCETALATRAEDGGPKGRTA